MEQRPTDLREVELRGRVEADVRAEFAEAEAAAIDRDRALRALVITAGMSLALGIPFTALVLGLSWRILRWSAGGSW